VTLEGSAAGGVAFGASAMAGGVAGAAARGSRGCAGRRGQRGRRRWGIGGHVAIASLCHLQGGARPGALPAWSASRPKPRQGRRPDLAVARPIALSPGRFGVAPSDGLV